VSPARAAAAREAFRAGQVRVLVGTQMAVRLCAEAPVGLAALVLADATLHLPDFRAAERTFQLAWYLAEGVAPGGSLWLQSFYPDHPALEAVAQGAREPHSRSGGAPRLAIRWPAARPLPRDRRREAARPPPTSASAAGLVLGLAPWRPAASSSCCRRDELPSPRPGAGAAWGAAGSVDPAPGRRRPSSCREGRIGRAILPIRLMAIPRSVGRRSQDGGPPTSTP
jgi:hypothetical protein